MSDDYYPGPAEDRITEFTRARAAEVRAELVAIADSMAELPELDDLYFNRLGYATATGSGDEIIVTLSPAPEAYLDGMGLTLKLTATNTGPATINVNSLGVKALRRADGSVLSGGDLQAGSLIALRYEGVSGQFRIMVGTVTINQAGIDLVTAAAAAYAAAAEADRIEAAASAAAAAASIAPYSAADVLTKIRTVDGTGSGLDADQVQGVIPGSVGKEVLAATTTAIAKTAIALGNVDNTSDANKPISTAVQEALNQKVSSGAAGTFGATLLASTSLASGRTTLGITNVEDKSSATIRGEITSANVTGALGYTPTSIIGLTGAQTPAAIKDGLALTGEDVGLGNVNNTSDASKPISTAQQTALDLKLNRTGGTMTGALTLAGNPTQPLEAASKQYADAISTTVPASGGPAVLATITNDTLSGLAARDGVTPVAGQRVLVPAQTAPEQNGIYVAAAGAWTRATDADTFAKMDKMFVLVLGGSASGGWSANNGTSGTLETTPIVWQRVSIQASNTASNGVTKVGNDFQLATMAASTIKGNNTGGATTPDDLTVGEVKTMLNLTGTNSGDQTTITGNAGSATILQTARTINGVSFNGSASITINAVDSTAREPAFATLGVAKGGTGVTTSTGTGSVVLSASPTFTGTLGASIIDLGSRIEGVASDLVTTPSFTWTGDTTTGIYRPAASQVAVAIAGVQRLLITASGISATNLSGTNTGDQTTITGNAGTATALATGRTIGTTGDVTFTTSTFNGTANVTGAATIAADAVTNAKLANMAVSTLKGRVTAGTGDPEDLTVAQVKTLLGLTGTNSGDQTITLTGDVTGSGTGSFAATIGAGAVTNAKLTDMAAGTFKGRRATDGTGDPQDVSIADAKVMLNLTGTNSGDQTTITGNAGSATILASARNFSTSGGATGAPTGFNGNANVIIPITGLDMAYANAGILPVVRGGTGSNNATGTGAVVLQNNPTIEGTLTMNGAINASGNITASGNVTAYSDARLKADVATIEDALAKVNRMRGVSYSRLSDGAASSGVIAQELLDEAPELVIADEAGMLSVAYGNLVGYLIEAVKELAAKVERLEGGQG